MLRMPCVVRSLLFFFTLPSLAQDSRHFILHYDFTVNNLPKDKKVRIWVPAAHSDSYQEVKVV